MNSYHKKKIILVSRCSWTLYNFRAGMMRALQQADYTVLGGGSGGDGFEPKISALGVSFKRLPIKKKGMNPLSDLKLLYLLWKWYRSERDRMSFIILRSSRLFTAVWPPAWQVYPKLSIQ